MSSIDVTDVKDAKKQNIKTEMMKHKGWIENLRNEKRTMKE
jgi:hypothetical protein